MTKAEIILEARKRHRFSIGVNYLNEGRAMGFAEGAEWMQQQMKNGKKKTSKEDRGK